MAANQQTAYVIETGDGQFLAGFAVKISGKRGTKVAATSGKSAEAIVYSTHDAARGLISFARHVCGSTLAFRWSVVGVPVVGVRIGQLATAGGE